MNSTSSSAFVTYCTFFQHLVTVNCKFISLSRLATATTQFFELRIEGLRYTVGWWWGNSTFRQSSDTLRCSRDFRVRVKRVCVRPPNDNRQSFHSRERRDGKESLKRRDLLHTHSPPRAMSSGGLTGVQSANSSASLHMGFFAVPARRATETLSLVRPGADRV